MNEDVMFLYFIQQSKNVFFPSFSEPFNANPFQRFDQNPPLADADTLLLWVHVQYGTKA